MGQVLRQVPLLSWLPAIPRDGSTIMLGAFFRMAIMMAGDDPAMAQAKTELTSYYDANADAWLDVSEKWALGGSCGSGYFGNHIAYIMAYVYATLEPSPARRARIAETIFDQKMWKALEGHKNPYFAFLWGGTRSSPAPGAIAAAAAQLSQFGPGPRVNAPRNELANYPQDSQCTFNGQPQAAKTTAVDVGVRVVDDFIWQRDPWGLYADGNALEVFPGVDYLAAYWAGRRHGFLADDRPGVCARFGP